jgi:hypothetical protein
MNHQSKGGLLLSAQHCSAHQVSFGKVLLHNQSVFSQMHDASLDYHHKFYDNKGSLPQIFDLFERKVAKIKIIHCYLLE